VGSFRDYAKQVLQKLESAEIRSEVVRLGPTEAAAVLEAIREIKRASDPGCAGP